MAVILNDDTVAGLQILLQYPVDKTDLLICERCERECSDILAELLQLLQSLLV